MTALSLLLVTLGFAFVYSSVKGCDAKAMIVSAFKPLPVNDDGCPEWSGSRSTSSQSGIGGLFSGPGGGGGGGTGGSAD